MNKALFPYSSLPNPGEWAVRFRNLIYFRFEQSYLLSHNRDAFLEVAKTDLVDELLPITLDKYLTEITRIWRRGFSYRIPLVKTMQQIETVRQKYYELHTASFDYKEMFDVEDVNAFVVEEDPREIIKFLIAKGVYNYFFNVVQALEIARKRGGLREREEMAILLKAKNGEKINAESSQTEIGFKWNGIKAARRLETLYERLRQKGFINKYTSQEDFNTLFSDLPVDNRVMWLKTSKQLLLFIETLLDKELIFIPSALAKKRNRSRELFVKKTRGKTTKTEENELRGLLHEVNHWLYPLIGACFKNKKGIPFTSNSLKHTRNDIFNKQKYPKAASEFENMAVEIMTI